MNNKNNVGAIHHIEWKNNHLNVMLVAEGSMFRIWDLNMGSVGSGTKLNFLSEVDFQGMTPRFRVNMDNTLMGSQSHDGHIKLYNLGILGHAEFSFPVNVSSPGCSLF